MEKIVSIHPTLSCRGQSASKTMNAGQACLPLRLVREGEWVRIVSVNGGKGLHDRLAGVGLRIGERMQIIRNGMDGKLLLAHEGTRLFLGGGMAQKIQVVIVEGVKE